MVPITLFKQANEVERPTQKLMFRLGSLFSLRGLETVADRRLLHGVNLSLINLEVFSRSSTAASRTARFLLTERARRPATCVEGTYGGVSENRGPKYSTLNSRILIIRTPK